MQKLKEFKDVALSQAQGYVMFADIHINLFSRPYIATPFFNAHFKR